MSGPEVDRKRKQIIKLFKECKLNITIQTNIHIVDFLDAQFNLKNMSFKPYCKPNNEPTYINKDSIHPTSVLKELCKSIAKRISEISSNEIIFKESIGLYQNALKTSGFNEKLEYSVKDDENHVEREEKEKRENVRLYGLIHYSLRM